MNDKFHAHGALPEDLAHKIFEAINELGSRDFNRYTAEGVHQIIDAQSMKVQQAVADAFSDLTFKLINRRGV